MDEPSGQISTQGGIQIEISPGELLDRLSILTIKLERISNVDKCAHVRSQMIEHTRVMERSITDNEHGGAWLGALVQINTKLWDAEDSIRQCEALGDFGSDFVHRAREIYCLNDRRNQIKEEINAHFGSSIREQKCYTKY